MVTAINLKMDGITKVFSDKVWAIINKNPRCPWQKIGTKLPIAVPGNIETIEIKQPITEIKAPVKAGAIPIKTSAKPVVKKKAVASRAVNKKKKNGNTK